jgi:hypothetical protein
MRQLFTNMADFTGRANNFSPQEVRNLTNLMRNTVGAKEPSMSTGVSEQASVVENNNENESEFFKPKSDSVIGQARELLQMQQLWNTMPEKEVEITTISTTAKTVEQQLAARDTLSTIGVDLEEFTGLSHAIIDGQSARIRILPEDKRAHTTVLNLRVAGIPYDVNKQDSGYSIITIKLSDIENLSPERKEEIQNTRTAAADLKTSMQTKIENDIRGLYNNHSRTSRAGLEELARNLGISPPRVRNERELEALIAKATNLNITSGTNKLYLYSPNQAARDAFRSICGNNTEFNGHSVIVFD